MSEESAEKPQPEKEKITLEMLMQSLGDLRYSVSQFQDSIEEYLAAIEETWREVKSWLASIEARLAGMEVSLSSMAPDADWQPEQIDQMLVDLNAVGADLAKMRQRFRSFTRGTLERVN